MHFALFTREKIFMCTLEFRRKASRSILESDRNVCSFSEDISKRLLMTHVNLLRLLLIDDKQ